MWLYTSVLCLTLSACALGQNYPEADGPRYSGNYAQGSALTSPDASRPLKVVSFNVRFGREIDKAAQLIQAHDELSNADILLLQEMDEAGADAIARALNMNYVYYPATRHPQSDRDFGNAILSPWPISDDAKLILPHLGSMEKTQRVATKAHVTIGDTRWLVYSLHLGTKFELGSDNRRDQAQAIIDDVPSHEAHVLIGGDFNGKEVAPLIRDAGFDWVTQKIGKTTYWASIDHFFLRVPSPESVQIGKIRETDGASDHMPIWASIATTPFN